MRSDSSCFSSRALKRRRGESGSMVSAPDFLNQGSQPGQVYPHVTKTKNLSRDHDSQCRPISRQTLALFSHPQTFPLLPRQGHTPFPSSFPMCHCDFGERDRAIRVEKKEGEEKKGRVERRLWNRQDAGRRCAHLPRVSVTARMARLAPSGRCGLRRRGTASAFPLMPLPVSTHTRQLFIHILF